MGHGCSIGKAANGRVRDAGIAGGSMDHPRGMIEWWRWLAAAVIALGMSVVGDDAAAFGTVVGQAHQGTYHGSPSTTGSLCSVSSCSLSDAFDLILSQQSVVSCGGTEFTLVSGQTAFWNAKTKRSCNPDGSFTWFSAQIWVIAGSGTECPADSTLVSGSTCRCNPGFRALSNFCEPYDCIAGENAESASGIKGVQANGLSTCIDGCKASGDSAYQGADGSWWVFGPHRQTGERCEGGGGGQGDVNTPPSPDNDGESGPPSPCAKGLCPGTVNGSSVCVPCQTSTTEGTTTTNPDGSTTTETTTCNQATGRCTTTITTTPPPGGGGDDETTTEEEPIGKFCEENPTSPLCKQSSFSGGCGGSFQCEGDAVQCAIARDQHERACQFFETPNPWSTKAEQMATGEARPDGHPLNDQEETSLSFASGISQTDLLGSGCPQNVSVSVSGMSLTIPWGNFCDQLQLIGNLAVAVSMLAAAMIVFRS